MSVHFRLITLAMVIFACFDLFAQLQVEVKDGAVAEYNMAVSPLAVLDGADGAHAEEITSAVEKVLDITGYFRVLDKKSFLEKPETAFKAVNFKSWLDVGANGLIKGTIKGKEDIEL